MNLNLAAVLWPLVDLERRTAGVAISNGFQLEQFLIRIDISTYAVDIIWLTL